MSRWRPWTLAARYPPSDILVPEVGAEVVLVGLDGLSKDAKEDRRAVGVLIDRDCLRAGPSRLALLVLTQRALPSGRGAERQVERLGPLTEGAGPVSGDAGAPAKLSSQFQTVGFHAISACR
jgi:hypothetical protein